MNIRFGEISTAQLTQGAKLFDHQTNRETLVTDTYRETPDGSDHSGLFFMYAKLDGKPDFERVAIDEGEKIARFSVIG